MCGIVGYIGKREAAPILVEGLRRLEYRGYDSAGIACARNDKLSIFKSKGKVRDLERALPERLKGSTGIAHTRWATHGEPSDRNAHPHTDASERFAIVHNGIVENAAQLRASFISTMASSRWSRPTASKHRPWTAVQPQRRSRQPSPGAISPSTWKA